MQEIVYHTNYKLESSYWWFVARNNIVKSLIMNRTDLAKGSLILDVGCGTGGFAQLISDVYKPVCIDTSPIAIEYCKKRNIENAYVTTLKEFDTKQLNISAVTMLDVIEHIEDDFGVVSQVYDALPSGGWFIASVPAFQRLWSKHDEIHHHFRRYNRMQFDSMLKKAGFNIKYSTYFNTFLFLPAILKRAIDKITGAENKKNEPVEEVSPAMNNLFTKIFMSEKNILRKGAFPFGLSIITIARKD